MVLPECINRGIGCPCGLCSVSPCDHVAVQSLRRQVLRLGADVALECRLTGGAFDVEVQFPEPASLIRGQLHSGPRRPSVLRRQAEVCRSQVSRIGIDDTGANISKTGHFVPPHSAYCSCVILVSQAFIDIAISSNSGAPRLRHCLASIDRSVVLGTPRCGDNLAGRRVGKAWPIHAGLDFKPKHLSPVALESALGIEALHCRAA